MKNKAWMVAAGAAVGAFAGPALLNLLGEFRLFPSAELNNERRLLGAALGAAAALLLA